MSFTNFPELPVELRVTIWEHALPGPRTIEITNHSHNNILARAPQTTTLNTFYHTCTESRRTLLSHYSLFFSDRLENQPLWFAPKLDTLYISDSIAMTFLSKGSNPLSAPDLSRIQHLALQMPIQDSW